MPLFNSRIEFYQKYEMPLARALHAVDRRGLLVSLNKIEAMRDHVARLTLNACNDIGAETGLEIVAKKDKLHPTAINIGSSKDIIKLLTILGLKVPTVRGTNKETTNEPALQKLLGLTGHPVIKNILYLRELSKLRGTYLDAVLDYGVFGDFAASLPKDHGQLFSSFVATGTKTGRRSSRENIFGLGTNLQNLPKHSALGMMYRKCIVARPGKIFIECDQKGAEDWVVQALITDLGGSNQGLEELHAGINRHKKLASFIFGKPTSECGKDTPYYDLGKRTRHGGQYDMRGYRMSETLAKEGIAMSPNDCDFLLNGFHRFEPDIRNTFHRYIQNELVTRRTLVTPIGRIREFYSLRPFSDNSEIFREGYAQIPQSTIGDNTGLALLYCEQNAPGLIVADWHDALFLEVDNNFDSVCNTVRLLLRAFDRPLTFNNGTVINVPTEIGLGFSPGDMKPCDNLAEDSLLSIWIGLSQAPNRQFDTIFGAPPQ